MKLLLRLLLGLCIVFAVIYAATPLWLEGVIRSQLPPQWQLKSIKTAYPGLTGIHVHMLELSVHLPAAEVDINANDAHLSYRELQTHVDGLNVDIYIAPDQDTGKGLSDINTIDDALSKLLSVPVIQLPGDYRQLSAARLDLAIHRGLKRPDGEPALARPLETHVKNLTLVPYPDGRFHLSADVESSIAPIATGRLEVEKAADRVTAGLTFPADQTSLPWLTIRATQDMAGMDASTDVQIDFRSDRLNGTDIQPLTTEASDGLVTALSGQLSGRMVFAGSGEQEIQSLTLDLKDLQTTLDGTAIKINTYLRADRDDQQVNVELLEPLKLKTRDTNNHLQTWLEQQIPELQQTMLSDANIDLMLSAGGRFVFGTGGPLSIQYRGSEHLELENQQETLTIASDDLNAEMPAWPDTDSLNFNGHFDVQWDRRATISYVTESLDISAEAVSVSTKITAKESHLTGNGRASIEYAKLTEPATRVDHLDINWTDFDLHTLSGQLAILTRGFQSTVNGEDWKGFELDGRFQLSNADQLAGQGNLIPHSGPNLPFLASGSIEDNRWTIDIPTTTIKSRQAGTLLAIANMELPPLLTLQDGDIDISGKVSIDDHITAHVDLNGQDVDVSIKESLADDMNFSISGRMQDTVSANGSLSIDTIALAGGINITGFEAGLLVNGLDSISLSKLGAKLFDGNFSMDELHWSDSKIEATQAQLIAIDLGSLLQFADIDGLNGGGQLNITLPITQETRGIAVRNGTFQSSGSGFLAYRKTGVSATNIGLQALENFQYQQLSGTIDYQPDGKYVVTILLDGRNPELYDGYPVRFTLNINGSLPELFESLFITGDFEDAILKEIKKQ